MIFKVGIAVVCNNYWIHTVQVTCSLLVPGRWQDVIKRRFNVGHLGVKYPAKGSTLPSPRNHRLRRQLQLYRSPIFSTMMGGCCRGYVFSGRGYHSIFFQLCSFRKQRHNWEMLTLPPTTDPPIYCTSTGIYASRNVDNMRHNVGFMWTQARTPGPRPKIVQSLQPWLWWHRNYHLSLILRLSLP